MTLKLWVNVCVCVSSFTWLPAFFQTTQQTDAGTDVGDNDGGNNGGDGGDFWSTHLSRTKLADSGSVGRLSCLLIRTRLLFLCKLDQFDLPEC